MVRKKKDIWCNGYMTIEAALLFPVIFTVIILMLYTGFFVYDRCLLENSAYIAALRGSRMQLMDNEEIYEETYELAKDLVENRIFAVNSIRQSVTVSFDEVEVCYEASVIPPVGTLLMHMTNKDYFKICVKKSAKRMKTIPIIREFRRAEQAMQKKS